MISLFFWDRKIFGTYSQTDTFVITSKNGYFFSDMWLFYVILIYDPFNTLHIISFFL